MSRSLWTYIKDISDQIIADIHFDRISARMLLGVKPIFFYVWYVKICLFLYIHTQHQKLKKCCVRMMLALLASEVRKHLNVCQQALD